MNWKYFNVSPSCSVSLGESLGLANQEQNLNQRLQKDTLNSEDGMCLLCFGHCYCCCRSKPSCTLWKRNPDMVIYCILGCYAFRLPRLSLSLMSIRCYGDSNRHFIVLENTRHYPRSKSKSFTPSVLYRTCNIICSSKVQQYSFLKQLNPLKALYSIICTTTTSAKVQMKAKSQRELNWSCRYTSFYSKTVTPHICHHPVIKQFGDSPVLNRTFEFQLG